jgi:hypothetical protein
MNGPSQWNEDSEGGAFLGSNLINEWDTRLTVSSEGVHSLVWASQEEERWWK